MYKQVIIARKDLNMSPGKLAAQVAHGSMAFLTNKIRKDWSYWTTSDGEAYYSSALTFEKDVFEQWINGAFTKTVLRAKNKNQLLKAKTMAEEMGMVEGEDFYCIFDNCLTELEPEEEDGRTLTVIGFKPMDSEVIDKIGRKYHLYI